ncbi:DUF2207 domain-containing protein [Tessaracoccus antarcticus]|uniref:DUF2207 domain-containing protein n=1 Tax=Tessaracoccus antarcticus TaxID=2479848 RepID=A0A3M0GFL4_9ACTN|nr:DUF2207 domain-containing protein [Tessaracoccus antarcticus]RMB61482.1 DUF2207 domain-containing protein [Tessaracoccus antarcticus]
MLTLWRKWIAYPIGWVVLMVVALALVAAVSALGKTYPDMESFHGRYEAHAEGAQVRLEVEEEISVMLVNERGIVRDLVTKYGDDFQNVTGISVEDKQGQPVDFDEDRDRATGDIELAIGGGRRVSGLRTYVIKYTITNAMVGTNDYQELYFNTNGTEWQNGFTSFSARLLLDDTLAGRLNGQSACYRGRAGSREQCMLQKSGQTYRVDADGLGPRENVTLAVGFEPGTVTDPLPPLEGRSLGWLGIALTLGVGALMLAVSLIARAAARDLRHGETGVVTQFMPPKGIEPVLAADFLGLPERGAAAHLAWLVLNGHGEITSSDERPGAQPGPGSDDLSLSQRADLGEDLRLRWHGEGMTATLRRITELLFGMKETHLPLAQHRRTSDLAKAQHYRDSALEDLYLRKASHLGPTLLWIGFLALIGFGWYQIWAGLTGLGWWFLLAGVVSTVMVLYAVHVAPAHGRLTPRGKEVRRELMGLERFVTASEANRIAWLQNAATAPREDDRIHLYERLLPWAIIFGAERSWAQLVGDMYNRFPESPLRLPVLTLVGPAWLQQDREFYGTRNSRSRRSAWYGRPDIGRGSLATGWSSTVGAISDLGSGSGSSNSSTRSSGRGWSGGSSSRSRGGSSRRGSSGGGTGGGGGGRR